jgi:DNA repair protein RadC
VEQLPLFLPDEERQPLEADTTPPYEPRKKTRRLKESEADTRRVKLREALAAYGLDVRTLRRLVIDGADIRSALNGTQRRLAPEAAALLDAFSALLTPAPKEQITRPKDIADFLMVKMGHLMQEEMWVVCLSTKNHIQGVHTVYKGSVNMTQIRIGEMFRDAIRYNSTAVIYAHNHPSGAVEPSPDDVMMTRALVQAGELLSCEVLDHLVIGQGKWLSMRERGLGFFT